MAPELNIQLLDAKAGGTAVRGSPPASTHAVRWLFRIHRWTGLLAGIPMVVILISGTVAVFKDEIDELLNPSLLVVKPVQSRVSIDEALGGVLPAQSVLLPDKPHRPYLVYRRSPDGKNEQVAIDPYRGVILGARPANGHVADFIRQLHVRFYFFGATGRIVVGVFGLMLAVSGITGLILYPRFLRGGQRWYGIRWSRGPQWVNSDIHKLAGIITLAVNLLWAITGTVLGLENLTVYYPAARKYLHPQPSVDASTGPLSISLETAISASSRAIEGFAPRSLIFPTAAGKPLIIYGNTAGNWTARSSSWVALDPSTGRVLQTHDERHAHLVTQIYNLHDPLHFGYFGGTATRWLWLVLGVIVCVLPISGYAIWWLKSKPPPKEQSERIRP
jgi:uncharacterized iron-regulated membrane protein